MKNLIIILLLLALAACGSDSKNQLPSAMAVEKEFADYAALQAELEEMYFKDQDIRRIIVDSLGFNSPAAGPYITKMMELDSFNQLRIKEILQEHGWLPKSKIGEKASDAIFYVVQHSDVELMDKYFPLLQEMALKNEAKKVHAAMMEDRLLMWKHKKQKYGTQASGDLREDHTMAIWPIENPEGVNELRKSAGFTQTVEEYAKSLNAEYDRNEALIYN